MQDQTANEIAQLEQSGKRARRLGRLEEAAAYFGRAVEAGRTANDDDAVAKNAVQLAGIHLTLRNITAAQALNREVIVRAPHSAAAACAHGHEGLLQLESRELEGARLSFTTGYRLAKDHNRSDIAAVMSANMALVQMRQGLMSDAVQLLDQAIATFAQLKMEQELDRATRLRAAAARRAR